eukprot:14195290-Heterocapsa_arctica.AAC.1
MSTRTWCRVRATWENDHRRADDKEESRRSTTSARAREMRCDMKVAHAYVIFIGHVIQDAGGRQQVSKCVRAMKWPLAIQCVRVAIPVLRHASPLTLTLTLYH